MKIAQKIVSKLMVGAGALALAGFISSTRAATVTGFTNDFPNGANAGQYPAPSFNYWYSVYQDAASPAGYNLQGTNDASTDFQTNASSGSMYVYAPFTTSGDQNVFYITFSDLGKNDQSQTIQINTITNISWYIHVSPNSPTNTDGNFGTLSGGLIDTAYGRDDTTYLTIPHAATNGWVLMSETNTNNFISIANTVNASTPNNAMAFGICFDQNSYGGFPKSPITYWIDHVTVQTASKPPPPPPPPSLLPPTVAVGGLNLFAGGSTGLNQREDLETLTGLETTWVGAPNPVTYAFTITNYPVAKSDQFQTQIFLVPNPDTATAPDYNDPNCIFLDMESTATGSSMTFRYKTNNGNGNSMIYGTNAYGLGGAVASIPSAKTLGTYSLTFSQNTNVTMTAPDGTTTNFFIQDDAKADTISLFASGVALYFGVQGNNAAGENDHIVVSDFKVTGIANAFDDNFIADNGVLNTAIWQKRLSSANALQLLGPGSNVFWVEWTQPAASYVLQSTPAYSTNNIWTPATANKPIVAGAYFDQLVATNDLQPGANHFFNLVQRTFTQLQVLLPGETNAPNTTTGKTGTPTAESLSGTGGLITCTVLAVDAHWNPIPGVTDTIAITDTGGGVNPNNAALVGGSGQFTVYYQSTGNGDTITASDVTTTSILPNTSSLFNVAQ